MSLPTVLFWGRETALPSPLYHSGAAGMISFVGKIQNPKLVLSEAEVSQIENCWSLADRPC